MSETSFSDVFFWPFDLTVDEIVTWRAVSDRMRAHLTVPHEQIQQAMTAMGLTWGDLEGFGSAVEGICETMRADQAEGNRLRARESELKAKLAEYENDPQDGDSSHHETPTRRELALVKRKLEAMEQAATDAILVLGGFDPAKVAEDMGAVADRAIIAATEQQQSND